MEASRGQTEAQTGGGARDDVRRDESAPEWVRPSKGGGRGKGDTLSWLVLEEKK